MRQYPQHHVLNGALLLKHHPGQVQQHLVPLHLQLRPLVQLGVPQADAAELEVGREYFLVVHREVAVVLFVYHL